VRNDRTFNGYSTISTPRPRERDDLVRIITKI
jgi:hypothetical protein